MQSLLYLAPICGAIGLLYAFLTAGWVNKQDAGTDRMKAIGEKIQAGAMAFLATEYKVLGIFVLVVAGALMLLYKGQETSSWLVGVSFMVGGVASFVGRVDRIRTQGISQIA